MEYKSKVGFNPAKDALEILPENIRESISRRITITVAALLVEISELGHL